MRAGSSAHQAEFSVERHLNVNRRAQMHAAMESLGMNIENKLAFSIMLGLAMGCSTAALAQEEIQFADDGSVTAARETSLDPIIVTATFGKSHYSELGTAASTISSSIIESVNTPSITDFLRLTPSLNVSTAGPIGTQTQVRIRGSEANHTIVFVDGIKANDPAAASEYGFSESMSSNISSIEVLRGSQSAMYGSEAIGGVISIFTRSPFDVGSKLFADVSGGFFGTLQANGGGAWHDDVLGLSLSAGLHRTNGINISPTGSEKDGSQTMTLHGKAEAKPSETTRIGFTLRYVEQRSDYDDVQFFDATIPYVVDTENLQQKSKRLYARAFAEFGSESWENMLYSNIVSTRNAQRNGKSSDDVDRDGGRVTLGYRTSLQFGTDDFSHKITAAAEHERDTYKDRSAAYTGGSRQNVSRSQNSIIGQYRLGISSAYFIDAGVRQDFNSGFANATTWRFSASANINDNIRFHGSAGRGVTNPTFVEQFGFFPGSFKGNEALVPEQSTGWDGGIEWRNDWLRIDATYFSARLKNEINTEFDDAFIASPFNESGTSKRSGVEVSLDARKDAFSFMAFYSYLKADEQRSVNAARTDEIRRPKHQGAITLIWDQDDLSLATSVSYTGKRLDEDFRSFPAPRLTLPAYTLATLSGQYKFNDNMTAFARIENAFNTQYQDVFGYSTAKFGAYAGLKLRLD
jgi:vitamin B12 transporter